MLCRCSFRRLRARTWCGLLIVAACANPVSVDIEQLDVVVTASTHDMSAWEAVEFHVVAHNTTDGTLRFTTDACVLVVRLLDRRGFPVFESPSTCNGIGLSHELAPGSFLEESIGFDGTTSWGPFLDASGNEARSTLAPGVYEVVAGVSSSFVSVSPAVELRIHAVE